MDVAISTQAEVQILTEQAERFITLLAREFESRRQELLARRRERQQQIMLGAMPDFLPETAHVREENWSVASIPLDLLDRRVEITGPVDRKMIINALNSGANVFMADFEESNAPTWSNLISGQQNLKDAVRRHIELTAENGKHYQLNEKTAVLFVRPRGW